MRHTISKLRIRRALQAAKVPTTAPATREADLVVKAKNTIVKRTTRRRTMTTTTSTTGTRRKRNRKATRKMWLVHLQQSQQGCRKKLTETRGTVILVKAMESRCIRTKIGRCSKIRKRSMMRRTKKMTLRRTRTTTRMRTSTTRTRTTWTSSSTRATSTRRSRSKATSSSVGMRTTCGETKMVA